MSVIRFVHQTAKAKSPKRSEVSKCGLYRALVPAWGFAVGMES